MWGLPVAPATPWPGVPVAPSTAPPLRVLVMVTVACWLAPTVAVPAAGIAPQVQLVPGFAWLVSVTVQTAPAGMPVIAGADALSDARLIVIFRSDVPVQLTLNEKSPPANPERSPARVFVTTRLPYWGTRGGPQGGGGGGGGGGGWGGACGP